MNLMRFDKHAKKKKNPYLKIISMHIYLHAHYGKKTWRRNEEKKNAEKDLKHRIGLHYFKIMKKCKKKKKNPHNLQIVKLTFPFS